MRKFTLASFPYKIDAQGVYFPVVPLTLKSGMKKKEFFALVDSGATVSIFQIEVAETLHINVETGQSMYLGGVGGRIKGYLHTISLSIAAKTLQVPVVFSYEYTVSFNLLGRKGIFEHFKIQFDEKKKSLSFT